MQAHTQYIYIYDWYGRIEPLERNELPYLNDIALRRPVDMRGITLQRLGIAYSCHVFHTVAIPFSVKDYLA